VYILSLKTFYTNDQQEWIFYKWHLVGMYFIRVALFLWFLCNVFTIFLVVFLSLFNIFLVFHIILYFLSHFFVISQVVINNIIERVFVLYISTFILCCILLDSSNIFSINNIKITRIESKLWFLILFKISNTIFSV